MLRFILFVSLVWTCQCELFDQDVLLEDVDCNGGDGFRPVGFLAFTYANCVFVVCDSQNLDRPKYASGCPNGKQTIERLADVTDTSLYMPPECIAAGLTVNECLVTREDLLCRIEVSTQDESCGPTYEDLKGQNDDPGADDVFVDQDYLVFGDPHLCQPLVFNRTCICHHPNTEPGKTYNFWSDFYVGVEVLGQVSGSPTKGHFVRDLFINTLPRNYTITVDSAGDIVLSSVDNLNLNSMITVSVNQPESDPKFIFFNINGEIGVRVRSLGGVDNRHLNVNITKPKDALSLGAFGPDDGLYGIMGDVENIVGHVAVDPSNDTLGTLELNTYPAVFLDVVKQNHRPVKVEFSHTVSCWYVADWHLLYQYPLEEYEV